MFEEEWHFEPDATGPGAPPVNLFGSRGSLPAFRLPTIRIPCSNCSGELQPHNPWFQKDRPYVYSETLSNSEKRIQVFAFAFQCQLCKKEPLLFMVRRDGLKLTLVGRSQFGEVSIPKFIPEPVRGFYRGAIIAFNTGHPLAAIFYLRTLIEQYMRSVVEPGERVTGDELARQYAETLPEDFRSRQPSFSKAYDDLSGAIHEAREDGNLFLQTLKDVERHFEAKPFFMTSSTAKTDPLG